MFFIYLRGGKERYVRNIYHASHIHPVQDWTQNLGIFPYEEWTCNLLMYRMSFQTTEPTGRAPQFL